MQAVVNVTHPPLTPKLIQVSRVSKEMKRDKLETIKFWSCQADKVTLCGLDMYFEGCKHFKLGYVHGTML